MVWLIDQRNQRTISWGVLKEVLDKLNDLLHEQKHSLDAHLAIPTILRPQVNNPQARI